MRTQFDSETAHLKYMFEYIWQTHYNVSMATKYTKERLEPIVQSSVSLAEVIRKLEIKWSGGQQQNIKRWIKIYELDTSHFLGQGASCGDRHKGGSEKKHWTEVLVLKNNDNRRTKAVNLRRALIESGVEYRCCGCGNEGLWQGKELRLQVNHKNGNWLDNKKENLEFVCPNCHSQTEGWSGSSGGTEITSTAKYSRKRRVDVVKLANTHH